MHGAEQASGRGPGRTWRNSVEVMDIADITDIVIKTGRQNMAEHGRI